MNAKQQLVQYYRWLRQYGLNDSHSGNASVRDDTDAQLIWVTPSGCCADTLQADDLIACPIDGTAKKGASLDAPMHQRVYQKKPTTGAVLHSHGPYSVALTLNGKDFSPVDFEGGYYFSSVPVIDAPYEDYVSRSPVLISDALRASPIAIYRGHGVYACAENLNLAYKWTCALELSAKTAHIAAQAGTLPT